MAGDKIDKETMTFAHLSDLEVAGMDRMLMRHDLEHEAVCCGSRDRIMYLSQMNAILTDKGENLCCGLGTAYLKIAELRKALQEIASNGICLEGVGCKMLAIKTLVESI